MIIRNANKQDFLEILSLNQDFVQLTSELDFIRLAKLAEYSCYFKVIQDADSIAAFLLAFGPDAPYESVNYQWFQHRYERFVYIDRIVVSQEHQGKKLGAWLYNDLFDDSSEKGFQQVVCEYNSQPINLPSQKFHTSFGFKEVGNQRISDSKVVSMQARELF